MRTFEVPVVVCVTVEVDDEGSAWLTGAVVDHEAGPWAGSADPVGFERATAEWRESRNDDEMVAAWNHAYDELRVSSRFMSQMADHVSRPDLYASPR